MKIFLQELNQKKEKFVLYHDHQSAINHSTFHLWLKHIDMRYYWIWDVLEMQLLQLEKVRTNDNAFEYDNQGFA